MKGFEYLAVSKFFYDFLLNFQSMYLARFVTKSDIKKSVRTLLNKTIGKVGAKNFTLYGKGKG